MSPLIASLLTTVSLITIVTAFQLEGSAISYAIAKFQLWNLCLNASLSFEFRMTQPDGLLLYMGDSGTSLR